MRAQIKDTSITFDLIQTTVEIGELTKLATKLGYSVVVEPLDGRNDYAVRMLRVHEVSLEDELVALAILQAFHEGQSGSLMLSRLQSRLEKRHFPLDRSIQDVMEIGGGPEHEGHEHD
ncbi:hypothetical protein [Aeromicrobium sp. Sec7.5]|uniref:hypothetical protein n=1 Tax=Aeromicrobium sp. Sec7.5 TaxID=3121276 RepID=UPI002FE4F0D4